MTNDDQFRFEHDDADLLGDMRPAVFHASYDWWRQLVKMLDDKQLAKLRASGLSITTWGGTGVEKTPLVPPSWLFDFPPPAA